MQRRIDAARARRGGGKTSHSTDHVRPFIAFAQPEKEPERPITKDQVDEVQLLKAIIDTTSHDVAFGTANLLGPAIVTLAHAATETTTNPKRNPILDLILSGIYVLVAIFCLYPLIYPKIRALFPGLRLFPLLTESRLKNSESAEVDLIIKRLRSTIPKSVSFQQSFKQIYPFVLVVVYTVLVPLYIIPSLDRFIPYFTLYITSLTGGLFYYAKKIHIPKRAFDSDIVNDNLFTDVRINLNLITSGLGQDSWKIYKDEIDEKISYTLKVKKFQELYRNIVTQVIAKALKKYQVPVTVKAKELFIVNSVLIPIRSALKINDEIINCLMQFEKIDLLKAQLLRLGRQLNISFGFDHSLKELAHHLEARAYADNVSESAKQQLSALFGTRIEFRGHRIIVTGINPVNDDQLQLIQAAVVPSASSEIVPQYEASAPVGGMSSHAYMTRELRERVTEEKEEPKILLEIKQPVLAKPIYWPSATYDPAKLDTASPKPIEGGPIAEGRVFVKPLLHESDFAHLSNGSQLFKQFKEQMDHPKIATRREKQGIGLGLFGTFTDERGVPFECRAKFKLLSKAGGDIRILCTTEVAPTGETLIIPKIIKMKAHKYR